MTPSQISRRIVLDRLNWVANMLTAIRRLPLADRKTFFADSRNLMTAESALRRALEALFDLGRHILAKGFGIGVSEYKEIARKLAEIGVLSSAEAELLTLLAGYRNRLVHYYHEVDAQELFSICGTSLTDIEKIQQAFRTWLSSNQNFLDQDL
jgi:uncharacterized protein YutE (UPF0331/DUF86 family)